MTLDEISQSLKASLYDRVSSPLFGTFVISWCLYNYRFLLVVFSSSSIEEKFTYIDTVLHPDRLQTWLSLFVCPAIATFVFLLLYHYPARWIFRIWRTQQKRMKEIRSRIEDETPLTIEESKKFKKQYEKSLGFLQTEIIAKDHRLSALQERLEEVQNANDALKNELNDWKGVPRNAEANQLLSDREVEAILLAYRFRLYFNPKDNRRSRMITFMRAGHLAEGRNNNEDSWRIANGRLEFIQIDGRVHSRFNYIAESNIFTQVNDRDTLGVRGQYMIPENIV